MVLVAAGLTASAIGAGLNFAAGRKRENAVSEAQDRLEAATSQFFTGKQERLGVLDRAFEALAAQRGTSIAQMLAARNSEARGRASDAARDGSATNIAAAQGVLQKRLTAPARAAQPSSAGEFRDSLADNVARLQPDVELAERGVTIGGARRGEAGFDKQLTDVLGRQLAQLGDQGLGLNIDRDINEAAKQNQFNAIMNQLGVRLDRAGEAGGDLRLIGGLLQQGGQAATSIGAFRQAPVAATAAGALPAAGPQLPQDRPMIGRVQ